MKHLGCILALALSTACGAASRAQGKNVSVDGSSTLAPVTEAVAEEFQTSVRNAVTVTVGTSGTGGGFKKLARGEIEVADASRPISQSEMEAAAAGGVRFLELPVCFDALTVVVHPDNDWCESLTVEELARIWSPQAEGQIMRWSQVREGWPDEQMALFGPGTDSGTFDYFTEAVVGKARSSRADYTASEDDNVIVRGIEGDVHALGYLGFAYYASSAGRLQSVKIDWEKDELGPVAPSNENVLAGIYNPLSRPLFLYVNADAAATKPHVKQFVEYYLEHVDELAREVHYLPLSSEAYAMLAERLARGETGTGFGGNAAVGVRVEEILSRPLSDGAASEAPAEEGGE